MLRKCQINIKEQNVCLLSKYKVDFSRGCKRLAGSTMQTWADLARYAIFLPSKRKISDCLMCNPWLNGTWFASSAPSGKSEMTGRLWWGTFHRGAEQSGGIAQLCQHRVQRSLHFISPNSNSAWKRGPDIQGPRWTNKLSAPGNTCSHSSVGLPKWNTLNLHRTSPFFPRKSIALLKGR